jgi:hypothetical protein
VIAEQPSFIAFSHTVARRLSMPYDAAVVLADGRAQAGYVSHDQSQHMKADRRGAVLPHSLTLKLAGRRLVKGELPSERPRRAQ